MNGVSIVSLVIRSIEEGYKRGKGLGLQES